MKNRKKRLPAVAMAVVLGATSSVGPVMPVFAEEGDTNASIESQVETSDEVIVLEEQQAEDEQGSDQETDEDAVSEAVVDSAEGKTQTEEADPEEEAVSKEEVAPEAETVPEAEELPENTDAPEISEETSVSELSEDIPETAEAYAVNEDGSVDINEENFPDSAFRGYVFNKLHSGWDMVISAEEIAKATRISGLPSTTASLKGIEFFTNLKQLDCLNTKITELDVSHNPKLEKINLGSEGVTELDVSQNPALSELIISGTGIEKIDVSHNPELIRLTCVYNKLAEIDVSSNQKLGSLSLAGTDVAELDVSQNPALMGLVVSDTKIGKLDVSQNPELTSLNVENTGISELDISHNPKLGTLYCNGSAITSLDISQNPLLTNVQCDNTDITELDVSNNPNLVRLHCDNTKLTGIDVSGNLKLTAGHFNTDLAWLNIGENPKLSDLTIKDSTINIGEVRSTFNLAEKFPGIGLDKITSIEGADLDKETGVVSNYQEGTPIVYTYACGTSKTGEKVLTVTLDFTKNENIEINVENFPDSAFRGYVYQNLNKVKQDFILTPEEIEKATRISGLPSTTASLKGIEFFTNLKQLDCVRTKITELDVSQNPKLEKMNLTGSAGITELDVSQNPALNELVISSTGIEKIDVSHNPELGRLTCVDSKLTEIDVSSNQKLGSLSLAGTDVAELDVSQNPALTGLVVSNTKIEKLDVSQNPELTSLNMENTGISELDISHNPKLGTLYCNGSAITSLDISQNPLLTNVQCSNTAITELDVSNNPNLVRLHCDNTKLTGIDVSGNLKLTAGHFNTDLAWLNIGENPKLSDLTIKDSILDIGKPGKTFCITEKFPGIDPEKILSVEGADLDRTTGIVSNYHAGTPIVYTYDCGTSKKGSVVLTVTLNFSEKEESTLSYDGDLNKKYDGKPVSEPNNLTQTGSMNNPEFEWYVKDGDGWKKMDSAPVNAGSYKLVITVPEDDDYAAVSVSEEFEIGKEESTVAFDAVLDKKYDGQAVKAPEKITQTGSMNKAVIEWYVQDGNGWKKLDSAPVDAGNYKIVVTVAEDENHTGAAASMQFVISAKTVSDLSVPEINNKDDLDHLEIKDGNKTLKEGTDYEVTVKEEGNVTEITIEFSGNYSGTVKQEYTTNSSSKKKHHHSSSSSDSSAGNAAASDPQQVSSPATGDTAQAGLWASVLALTTGMVAMLKKKKKNIMPEE